MAKQLIYIDTEILKKLEELKRQQKVAGAQSYTQSHDKKTFIANCTKEGSIVSALAGIIEYNAQENGLAQLRAIYEPEESAQFQEDELILLKYFLQESENANKINNFEFGLNSNYYRDAKNLVGKEYLMPNLQNPEIISEITNTSIKLNNLKDIMISFEFLEKPPSITATFPKKCSLQRLALNYLDAINPESLASLLNASDLRALEITNCKLEENSLEKLDLFKDLVSYPKENPDYLKAIEKFLKNIPENIVHNPKKPPLTDGLFIRDNIKKSKKRKTEEEPSNNPKKPKTEEEKVPELSPSP